MFVRRSLYYVSGKLLYLWARSQALSVDLVKDLAGEKNIIYVLEHRSWTNVMALEHECGQAALPLPLERIPAPFRAWRRVYTVAPRLAFKQWLEKKNKRSRMLRGLLEVLQENPQQEIYLVPVSVFWGRPVAKQKGWLRVLFAESWGLASRTRKFFTILFHGRDTLVKFNPAISFRECMQQGGSDDEIIDRLQEQLSQRLHDARTATLGPDVSHRRTLVRDIIQEPDSIKAIQRRAEEDNRTLYQANMQARRYLYEIVANCTTATIMLLQRVLTAFWNRFYSGIQVSHTDKLKQLSLSHELVYVPCHRSHVDYLLLSYVIHSQGLVIPYIAAGKNLNLPVIGIILRSAGAFFIRRSFRGNELYSQLLFEYLAKLLAMGMPVEYFVEGGRSRTGRLLKPKPGMLAMTIRAYLKNRAKPVAFIPVYIGYEKMIEGKSYVDELSGKKKQKENLFQTIKAIVAIRGEHGSVFTNFGEPIFLDDLLSHANPQWREWEFSNEQRPEWLKQTVGQCGTQIMTRVNQAASVTSTNLIAVALIAATTHHIDEAELQDLLECYGRMLAKLHGEDGITLTQMSGAEQIERVLLLKLIRRIKHPLGDIIYLQEKRLRLLNYYRNNVLHLFALPSLVACCFLNRHSQHQDTIVKLVKLAYPIIKDEFFLPWQEAKLEEVVEQTLEYFVQQKLLTLHQGVYSKPGAGTREFSRFDHLSRVILPVLELYYMIVVLLIRHAKSKISVDEMIQSCHLSSQRVFLIYQRSAPDFFDKTLISNFIAALVKQGYVQEDSGQLQINSTLEEIDRDARLLLSSQMRAVMMQLSQEWSNKQA